MCNGSNHIICCRVEKEVAADSKEAKKFLEEKSNNDTSLEPAAEHAPRSSESESRSFNPTITTATVAPTSPVAPKIATIGWVCRDGIIIILIRVALYCTYVFSQLQEEFWIKYSIAVT